MAERARGQISDRPWGRTLGTLGLRALTGQLTLVADRKRFDVAFAGGAVAGATSPLATDAAVRIAATGGLVSPTQVADLARRQAAAPHRDEVEVIAELARLGRDQAMRLRRRTVAQRAARTFAFDRGEFVIDDATSIPVVAGAEVDVRAVIYFGARQHLSDERLAAELARLGTWFRLRPEAIAELGQYGFGTEPADRAVLDRLRHGARLDELEQLGLDARTTRAIVYALASYNACETDAVAAPRAPVAPPSRRTADGSTALSQDRLAGAERRDPTLEAPTLRRHDPVEPPTQRVAAADAPTIPRRPPTARRVAARPGDPERAVEIQALIAQRSTLLASHPDHYTLLGVAIDARPEDIRRAYFTLARQLHPDRLASLGIEDRTRAAHRLFAHVNTAFAVLSDPVRREEYTDVLRRGGEAAVRAEQARAEELAERILAAEHAFRRGEAALRRDHLDVALAELARAVELAPDEVEYETMFAWAKFCAAPDKLAVAPAIRTVLERASVRAPSSVAPRFYLGRVERMLGRDREALRCFQQVLELSPHHGEAASELRLIEARLGDRSGGGLFQRKR